MSLFLPNLRHSEGVEANAKWLALITQHARAAKPTSQTLGQFSTYFCTTSQHSLYAHSMARIPLKSLVQNTFKYGRIWDWPSYLSCSSAEGGTQDSDRKKSLPSQCISFWVLGAKPHEFLCLECLFFYFVAQQTKKKRAGVEGREQQRDSFKTGKNTLRHGEKKKE